MEPSFAPAKAIPQFNCAQRSRLPIGLLLLLLALFLSRQAAADIISYPAITIPQTITAEPGSDCAVNFYDCYGAAKSSFTATAQNGAPLFGVGSTYVFQYVAPPTSVGVGAGLFNLGVGGAIWGGSQAINSHLLIAPVIGDTVGPTLGFQNFSQGVGEYIQYLPYSAPYFITSTYGPGGLNYPAYMGFEFQNAAQTYYGWLSLSVLVPFDFNHDTFGQHYTTDPPIMSVAYAYEACPNAPITIGATSGGATCSDPLAPTPEPPSLALCLIGVGVLGLALRHKYKAVT